MRQRLTIFFVILLASSLHAQTAPAAGTQIKCTIQSAPTASPALAAYAAGDWPTAESLYSAQIAAAPAAGYAGVVAAQLQANRLPQALASAQAAVAAMPKAAFAQSLLGDVSLRSGQLPAASAAYKQALHARSLLCSRTSRLGSHLRSHRSRSVSGKGAGSRSQAFFGSGDHSRVRHRTAAGATQPRAACLSVPASSTSARPGPLAHNASGAA